MPDMTESKAKSLLEFIARKMGMHDVLPDKCPDLILFTDRTKKIDTHFYAAFKNRPGSGTNSIEWFLGRRNYVESIKDISKHLGDIIYIPIGPRNSCEFRLPNTIEQLLLMADIEA